MRQVRGEVYSQVRQTFHKITLDKKQIELAKGNLEILRNFFSRIQQRLESGQALKNELQRARIELLRAENEYLGSEKELKTDKAQLNLLMGRAMEFAFFLSSGKPHCRLLAPGFRDLCNEPYWQIGL